MNPPWLFLSGALCALLLNGCGGGAGETAKKTANGGPVFLRVDPAVVGTIQGRIRYTGKPVARKRLSMDAEEACQAMQKEAPVFDEQVLTDKDGALANVFVYVQRGLEGKQFEPPQETVVLEQKGCRFTPRVIGLRTRQTLAVRNSDPVSHNIHPMPRNNRDWNQQQPPGAEDLKRRFGFPEVMIPVKCNVHAWMKAWIAVLDHPYFAVTGAAGAYSLEKLPAGAYTVAAWHERFGEQTRQVTLPAATVLSLDFEFR